LEFVWNFLNTKWETKLWQRVTRHALKFFTFELNLKDGLSPPIQPQPKREKGLTGMPNVTGGINY